MPEFSEGKSGETCLPKPYKPTNRLSRSAPTRRPIFTAPMLLDLTLTLVKDSRPLHLMGINLSGQPRQVLVGKQRIDLPIGRAVGLDWTAGDTLHVVSDTDSRVNARITVSRADAAHAVSIR